MAKPPPPSSQAMPQPFCCGARNGRISETRSAPEVSRRVRSGTSSAGTVADEHDVVVQVTPVSASRAISLSLVSVYATCTVPTRRTRGSTWLLM